MRLWKIPITNRTQNDVDRVIYLNQKVQTNTATADELTEWKNDLKIDIVSCKKNTIYILYLSLPKIGYEYNKRKNRL